MKTRFKFKGFFPAILSLVLIGIMINFSLEILTNSFYQRKPWVSLILLVFLIITFIWLVFGEVKNKFVVVNFEQTKISVKKFGGIFPKVEFHDSEVEGWKYSILNSRGGNYEYLYLYRGGKKIAKISEFYHQNYSEIKQHVKSKYKDLGFEQFSYLTEFREFFE